jgi:carboxylesterase
VSVDERHPVKHPARSHPGGDVGVLVLHGYTGNPGTMRPVADALVEAGFSVEVPRLPGHGTHVDDMLDTTFEDWSTHVEGVYRDLADRCRSVVVFGLSMGGTLAAWLAARHPVAGAVLLNAAVAPRDPLERQMIADMIAAGEEVAEGASGRSDIADPDAVEDAYAGSPLRPLLSLVDATVELQADLPKITCPTLVVSSREDHVVDPSASDHLASLVGGPVERLWLERSWHVATLDYDKDLLIERTIDFVRKVTSPA